MLDARQLACAQVTANSQQTLMEMTGQLLGLSRMFDSQITSLEQVEDLLKYQSSQHDVNHEEVTRLIKQVLKNQNLLGRPVSELQAEENLLLADPMAKSETDQFVIKQVLSCLSAAMRMPPAAEL